MAHRGGLTKGVYPQKPSELFDWSARIKKWTKPLDYQFQGSHPQLLAWASFRFRWPVQANVSLKRDRGDENGFVIRFQRTTRYLQYGVSLEPNFNQQPYRGTDGGLARRLRRRWHPSSHAPSSASRHARYNDGVPCRLVEHDRLQRRRDGELQRLELHGSVLDARRQSID